MTLFLLFFMYFISAAAMWLYIHLAYSKRGRLSFLSPDIADVVLCITPGLNTISALYAFIVFWPIENSTTDEKVEEILKNLFLIKNEHDDE